MLVKLYLLEHPSVVPTESLFYYGLNACSLGDVVHGNTGPANMILSQELIDLYTDAILPSQPLGYENWMCVDGVPTSFW